MTNDEFYSAIPEMTMAALRAYRDERRPTGDFLYAVLRNDLMDAVSRADEENLAAIGVICTFVRCQMPAVAHGSRERVQEWMEGAR